MGYSSRKEEAANDNQSARVFERMLRSRGLFRHYCRATGFEKLHPKLD
jgi:hypothetical protein